MAKLGQVAERYPRPLTGDMRSPPPCFGSVTFVLEGDVADEHDRIVSRRPEWLNEWINWYLTSAGIFEGRGLHLLYDRSVSVLGSGILDQWPCLKEVASVAGRHGATFAVEFNLARCIVERALFHCALDSELIKTILFDPRAADGLEPRSIARVVEESAARGIAVVLLGDPAFWLRAGVLASPHLNAVNFRMVPLHARRSDEANGNAQASPFRASMINSPCEPRFSVVVAPNGDLYPCIGLLGHRPSRIGTIFSNPEQSRLADSAAAAPLLEWHDGGPMFDRGWRPEGPLISGLPRICAAHRQALEAVAE